MGRKPYQPTPDEGERVAKLAAYGMDHDTIANVIGISDETLRKYYRRELDTGKAQTIERVAGRLVDIAMAGDVQAAKFYLAAQGNWTTDRQTHEHSGGVTVNIERQG